MLRKDLQIGHKFYYKGEYDILFVAGKNINTAEDVDIVLDSHHANISLGHCFDLNGRSGFEVEIAE